MRYIGTYKENDIDKRYSITADDLFDAQDRLAKIEDTYGIQFYDIGPEDLELQGDLEGLTPSLSR